MKLAEAGPAPTYRDRIFAFGAERFFNRELSWLEFNKRVLEESENKHNPLLERVRFLAISGSNLDEFYRVRVAGLHEQAATNILEVSPEGMTPKQQVQKINAAVVAISERQQARWTSLKKELAEEFDPPPVGEDTDQRGQGLARNLLHAAHFFRAERGRRRCSPSLSACSEPGTRARSPLRARR